MRINSVVYRRNTMNITILGHVCVDHNFSEGATYTSVGSPSLFIARIFKGIPQAHANIRVITPYGQDFNSYQHGLTLYPRTPSNQKTLTYENRSKGNLRVQKAYNRDQSEPVTLDDELISVIQSSDIIYFAPLVPNYPVEYIKSALSYVKDTALKILLPQGYYRDFTDDDEVYPRAFAEADELVPLFDFVMVSEQDHHEMLATAKRWSRDTKVILTIGEKGALFFEDGTSFLVGTRAVPLRDIVDSVGSGDIFSAAFGYKYLQSHDIYGAMKFANAIARQCLFSKAENLRFILPS